MKENGQWPVLFITFSATSGDSLVNSIRLSIRKAFKAHSYIKDTLFEKISNA